HILTTPARGGGAGGKGLSAGLSPGSFLSTVGGFSGKGGGGVNGTKSGPQPPARDAPSGLKATAPTSAGWALRVKTSCPVCASITFTWLRCFSGKGGTPGPGAAGGASGGGATGGSALAVSATTARRLPSGLNATERTSPASPLTVSSRSPVRASQRRTVRSAPPLAIRLPS